MSIKLLIFLTKSEIYGYDISDLDRSHELSFDGDKTLQINSEKSIDEFIGYIKDRFSIYENDNFDSDFEIAVIDCNAEQNILRKLFSKLEGCLSVGIYPLKEAVVGAYLNKYGELPEESFATYAGYPYKISLSGDVFTAEFADECDNCAALDDSDFYNVFYFKNVAGKTDQSAVENLSAKCTELNAQIEHINNENTELKLKLKDITEKNNILQNELNTYKNIELKKLAEGLKKKKKEELLNKKTIVYSCIPDNMLSMQNNVIEPCEIFLNFSNDYQKPCYSTYYSSYSTYQTYNGCIVKKDSVIACYYLSFTSTKENCSEYASSYGLDIIKGSSSFFPDFSRMLPYTNTKPLTKEYIFAKNSDECKVISPCDGKLFWLISEKYSLTEQRQPIAVIGNNDDTTDTINSWLKETGHTDLHVV